MIAHDELVHTIKQIASQAQIETRPWLYGHVSDYNPANNSVRVLVPSMLDDQTMAPLHSGWLPLGVPQSGGQSGLQVVPFGGATAENPTAGELCMVAMNERGTGVAAVVCMLYTDRQQPPHTALSSGLQPGEVVLRHVSGTIVRLHQSGDAEVTTGGDGAINATTSGMGGINSATSGAGGISAVTTGTGSIVIATTGGGGISIHTTGGSTTVSMSSDSPIMVEADLHVTGAVIAGFGTGDQVGLQSHTHAQPPDSHGDGEQPTNPPTAGT